jgi:hypothetical protein
MFELRFRCIRTRLIWTLRGFQLNGLDLEFGFDYLSEAKCILFGCSVTCDVFIPSSGDVSYYIQFTSTAKYENERK